MKYLVISDLHLNPARRAGTTLESRAALEDWQFRGLEKTLQTPHDSVIINGDLFHKNSVSEKTLLRIYELLKKECCILVRGNHDEVSERFNEICSLQLLAKILPNCTLVYEETVLIDDMYFIPHAFNQEKFNKFVESTPENVWVFIHANNNNGHAVEADHSLNLSYEQRQALINKGCRILLGHEHAAKEKKNFTVLGCLMPTSIADCLSGDKFYHIIEDGEITSHVSWHAENYQEMHWSEIQEPTSRFVRIVGDCELVELPAIVRSIADLRKKSDAFIIANAVKPIVAEKPELGKEEVTAFNIVELLLEQIDEEFRGDVETCV